MGEKPTKALRLGFNGLLKVAFQGSRVTSDRGLILVRELDDHLGMSRLITQHLTDPRRTNARLPLADLLRQSVYSRLAGYEDVPFQVLIGWDADGVAAFGASGGMFSGPRESSCQRRVCKLELQRLADETRLEISIRHRPPGTSKRNKIEHRLFSFTGQNWRGKPLVSHQGSSI